MTSRRLLDPVSRVLLDAADYIETHGWWDGQCTIEDGKVCASLAISEIIRGRDNYTELYYAAHDRLAGHVGCPIIPWWNDTHTAGEVVAAMRGAAVGSPLALVEEKK